MLKLYDISLKIRQIKRFIPLNVLPMSIDVKMKKTRGP